MDDTVKHREHSHSGTVTVEKQQQQSCLPYHIHLFKYRVVFLPVGIQTDMTSFASTYFEENLSV